LFHRQTIKNKIYHNILSDEYVRINIAIINSAKESLISAKEELAWAKQSLDAKEKRLGVYEIGNT
jgi:hypothetical protein